jgi:hypothetical protein
MSLNKIREQEKNKIKQNKITTPYDKELLKLKFVLDIIPLKEYYGKQDQTGKGLPIMPLLIPVISALAPEIVSGIYKRITGSGNNDLSKTQKAKFISEFINMYPQCVRDLF